MSNNVTSKLCLTENILDNALILLSIKKKVSYDEFCTELNLNDDDCLRVVEFLKEFEFVEIEDGDITIKPDVLKLVRELCL